MTEAAETPEATIDLNNDNKPDVSVQFLIGAALVALALVLGFFAFLIGGEYATLGEVKEWIVGLVTFIVGIAGGRMGKSK